MTALPPATPAPPGGRRRWWPWVAAIVVAGAAAATAAVMLTQEEDEAAPTAVTSELPDPFATSDDPDTAELARLLAAGRATTYHATYRSTGSADAAPETTTFEVWRAGGRLRQDTTTTVEGEEVRTSSYLSDDELVLCSSSGTSDWVCAAAVPSGTEADGLLGSVSAQLAGGSVTPRDDVVGGEAVRCFAYSGAPGEGDVCVTTDGVPVSVRFGELGIELAALERRVAPQVFDLPAEPVQGDVAG